MQQTLMARTNVKVEGARASHDIDVLVEFTSAGIDVTWVVECKRWERPIPKERVLVLRGVVDDVGADRGLIVAESGYQAGAFKSAQDASITLTSLDELYENTEAERARSEVSGWIGRISALNEAVRWAWQWSPPSTPQGGIPVDRMVEFAGDVFELHSMVLPKIVADSYPIRLVYGEEVVAADAAELRLALKTRIENAERESSCLRAVAAAAIEQLHPLIDTFERDLNDLIETGREITTLASAPAALELKFVASMRAISDGASRLMDLIPTSVQRECRALMSRLVTHTYGLVEAQGADWDAEHDAIAAFLRGVRAALRDVAALG